jgi:hypothetical protein
MSMNRTATLLLMILTANVFFGCADGLRPNSVSPKFQNPKAGDPTRPIQLEAPYEYDLVRQFSDQNPDLIFDCTGHPFANEFLIQTVRMLQQKDPRWGFFVKPDGRIPRDILAYAWGDEHEGTHNTYVIDFVASGCSNTLGDPNFNDPNYSASVWWNVTNPDGYASNGVWTANP